VASDYEAIVLTGLATHIPIRGPLGIPFASEVLFASKVSFDTKYWSQN